jgi:hypothetical protein
LSYTRAAPTSYRAWEVAVQPLLKTGKLAVRAGRLTDAGGNRRAIYAGRLTDAG